MQKSSQKTYNSELLTCTKQERGPNVSLKDLMFSHTSVHSNVYKWRNFSAVAALLRDCPVTMSARAQRVFKNKKKKIPVDHLKAHRVTNISFAARLKLTDETKFELFGRNT